MPRHIQAIINHADELLADRFEAGPEFVPLSDEQHAVIFELRDAVIERGRIEAHIRSAVARARAGGVSWSVIAAVLGTSRQAAQQRYETPKHRRSNCAFCGGFLKMWPDCCWKCNRCGVEGDNGQHDPAAHDEG